MPSDAIDLLFDWQDEEAEGNPDDPRGDDRVGGSRGPFGARLEYHPLYKKRKQWPPRQVLPSELACGSTRTCRECRDTYPETNEFFYIRLSGKQKGAVDPYCWGCRRSRIRSKKKANEHRHSFASRLRLIRGASKRRGIEWGFDDREDLRDLYDTPCHYCGGEVIHRLGIDRLDSDRGYVPGNVVQCCGICNSMKATHSVDEWVAHMERVLSHLRGTS